MYDWKRYPFFKVELPINDKKHHNCLEMESVVLMYWSCDGLLLPVNVLIFLIFSCSSFLHLLDTQICRGLFLIFSWYTRKQEKGKASWTQLCALHTAIGQLWLLFHQLRIETIEEVQLCLHGLHSKHIVLFILKVVKFILIPEGTCPSWIWKVWTFCLCIIACLSLLSWRVWNSPWGIGLASCWTEVLCVSTPLMTCWTTGWAIADLGHLAHVPAASFDFTRGISSCTQCNG